MFQHNGNGSPDEDDVEPDVPVSHVPGIHLDSLVIGRIAAAAGLPHTGDTGADHIEVFDKGAVFFDFIAYDRPRSDEAHVPCQDVEQLGQFVKASLAQKGSAFRNTRVVFQFEFCLPFFPGFRISFEEFFQFDVSIDAHAAEFIAVKFFPVPTDTAMFEDNRPRRIEANPQGYGQEERRQEDNTNNGAEQIKESFNGSVIPYSQVVAETDRNDAAVNEGIRFEGR